MKTHTPGPWNYAADSLREGRFSIYANGPIAYCGDAAEPGDGEANARLIAAAPELLAALVKIDKLAREADTDANSQAVLALQVGIIAQIALDKATQSNF